MKSFPTDHRFGQFHERFVDVVSLFVPRKESAVLMEPTQRPLDRPAVFAKAAAVRSVASSQQRLAPALPKGLTMRVRMIRPVSLNDVEATPWLARLARHRRHCIDQWQQLSHIMPVSTCKL